MVALLVSACSMLIAAGPFAQLDQLDRAVNALESSLERIEAQRAQNQEQLATITADLAASRARRATALTRFRRRLQALAAMPTGARLAVLGGTRSLADYLDVTRVLRWVARQDHDLSDRYRKESEHLGELEASLAVRAHNLETLDARAREERDRLAAERRTRLDLLNDVAARRELVAEAVKERQSAAQSLVKMVARLTPAGRQDARFAANRGRLPWPAVGPIVGWFGQQTDTASSTVTMSNGITVRAPAGASVQAIADGTVVFADWLAAYGQVVIIQHGDTYFTLVAHLASLAVSAGDAVAAGTVVGTVGDTGSLQGPRLYFEIREGATPVDPEPWLRR